MFSSKDLRSALSLLLYLLILRDLDYVRVISYIRTMMWPPSIVCLDVQYRQSKLVQMVPPTPSQTHSPPRNAENCMLPDTIRKITLVM